LFENSLISINHFSKHGFDEKKAEPVFKFLMKQTNNLNIAFIQDLEDEKIISDTFLCNAFIFFLKTNLNNFNFENMKILNEIEIAIRLSNDEKNDSLLIVSLKLYFKIYEKILIANLILIENENLCKILLNILNGLMTKPNRNETESLSKPEEKITLHCLNLIHLLITNNKTNRYFFENFEFFQLLIEKILNIFKVINKKIEKKGFEIILFFTNSKSNGYMDLGDANSDIFGSLYVHVNLLKFITSSYSVESISILFKILDNLTRECVLNCVKFLIVRDLNVYIKIVFILSEHSFISQNEIPLNILQNIALKIKTINNNELVLKFFDETMFEMFKNMLKKFNSDSIILIDKILTILNIFIDNFDDIAKYLKKIQIRSIVNRLYTSFTAQSLPVNTTTTTTTTAKKITTNIAMTTTTVEPLNIQNLTQTTLDTKTASISETTPPPTETVEALSEELNNKFLVFLSNSKLQNNNNEHKKFSNFQWRDDANSGDDDDYDHDGDEDYSGSNYNRHDEDEDEDEGEDEDENNQISSENEHDGANSNNDNDEDDTYSSNNSSSDDAD
jgi:hypothetical protein